MIYLLIRFYVLILKKSYYCRKSSKSIQMASRGVILFGLRTVLMSEIYSLFLHCGEVTISYTYHLLSNSNIQNCLGFDTLAVIVLDEGLKCNMNVWHIHGYHHVIICLVELVTRNAVMTRMIKELKHSLHKRR